MRSRLSAVATLLWWALLFFIPITSFPFVQATVGGETVSPLSMLPMIPLVPIAVAASLRRESRLPSQVLPIVGFAIVAVVSAGLSFAYPLLPFKNQTVLTRTIWGLGTLAVGLGFYMTASIMTNDASRDKGSLRALHLGALMMLIWGTVQVWYVFDRIEVIPWRVNAIHRLFSVRDMFRERVTGLAYEPSWFGNQLTLLYLPLWIGSAIRGFSVFPKVGKYLTVELVMAIWGIVLLFLGKSRVSIASLVLMLGAVVMLTAWRASERIVHRPGVLARGWSPLLVRAGTFLAGIMLLLLIAAGSAALIWRNDQRVQRLATIPTEIYAIRDREPYEVGFAVANRAAFAERVVIWDASFRIFEDYPLLGVGPGNSGFLLSEKMSDYGWGLTEVRIALDPENKSFPNSKSLWLRLLSETGLLGLAAFASWLIVIVLTSAAVRNPSDGALASIAFAAILSAVALLLEGFSLDTFALPHLWILPAFVTGIASRRAGPADQFPSGLGTSTDQADLDGSSARSSSLNK